MFSSISISSRIKQICFLLLLGGTILELSSCFQYPDGPIFTLTPRKYRLEGNWKISDVKDQNGVSLMNSYFLDTVAIDTSEHTVKVDTVFPYKYQTMQIVLVREG